MRDPQALRQGAIRLLALALRASETDSELSELLVACAMRLQDEAIALEEGAGATPRPPTSKSRQRGIQQERIQSQIYKGFGYSFSLSFKGSVANNPTIELDLADDEAAKQEAFQVAADLNRGQGTKTLPHDELVVRQGNREVARIPIKPN